MTSASIPFIGMTLLIATLAASGCGDKKARENYSDACWNGGAVMCEHVAQIRPTLSATTGANAVNGFHLGKQPIVRNMSPELIFLIKLRIQDPRKRNSVPNGETVGVIEDPEQLARMFEKAAPGSSDAFRDVVRQMEIWGQKMPGMHVTQGEGWFGASSEDPHDYPLAPPATESEFEALEKKIRRAIPRDLRQLYAIANGGFGPGLGVTPGFGPGIYSLKHVGLAYDDMLRRGPDYTGRISWPTHLLPLTDNFGPVSYDLNRGVIVAFDEYFEDKGLTAEDGFTDVHPSLSSWLKEWINTKN